MSWLSPLSSMIQPSWQCCGYNWGNMRVQVLAGVGTEVCLLGLLLTGLFDCLFSESYIGGHLWASGRTVSVVPDVLTPSRNPVRNPSAGCPYRARVSLELPWGFTTNRRKAGPYLYPCKALAGSLGLAGSIPWLWPSLRVINETLPRKLLLRKDRACLPRWARAINAIRIVAGLLY
jgi:hypothetical protein